MSDNKDMISKDDMKPDPDYWRSFEELYNDPAFIESSHHEFKEGVTDDFNPGNLSGLSRRKFLALVGASAALAAAGCTNYRDKGDIIPYVHKPEEITLGKPLSYASTCTGCSHACGILVKTREGRPIKIDGNPDNPVSKGKICTKGHADILSLYDPEKLSQPMKRGNGGGLDKTDWVRVDNEIIGILKSAGEKEIAIVTHKIISPTAKKVLDDFKAKYPSVKVYSYELFNEQNRLSTWQKSYGTPNYPLIKWNEAKVIISLESDFLGTEGNKVENTRLYSEGRNVDDLKNFNKLYVVEGNMSLTGMNSDVRIKLRPDAQFEFVMSLIDELRNNSVSSLKTFGSKYAIPPGKLNNLLKDIRENKGKVIVYAGRTLPENVHLAVNYLNELIGGTALYRTDFVEYSVLPLSNKEEIESLVSSMNRGKVAAVIHYDSNPVFHLPADNKYANALKNVPAVITLCLSENESSSVSQYVLPVNHGLESWGDAKIRNGFYSMQQPVIYPIHNSRQKEAILLTWISGKASSYNLDLYHNYMMDNWKNNIYPLLKSKLNFEQFWNGALHDGVVITGNIDLPNVSGQFNSSSFSGINKSSAVSGFVVALKESYSVGDGRYSNNGWLNELPHPVSKIVWDNYASISRKTSKELNVRTNDLIEITSGSRKLTIPVNIQPGCADNTITIELGFGRTNAGTISDGVGFNANILQSKDEGLSSWIITNVEVRKAGGSYPLAATQEFHAFDKGRTKDAAQKRNIIREGTVDEYKKNPDFLKAGSEEVENKSLYPPYDEIKKGVKWAMAVDLNKCLGCGECVISCYSENNIPVVGKEQAAKGRDMQWLRVDRYYSGDPEEPKVSQQLMLCQHCDHAPCENVCPVAATTHSPDGLNQMVYNRCVGTRYCSNNCPYKVRRFNYFNYRDHFNDGYQQSPVFNLIFNPEVTVRSRGVMEKCTFCVQRIMEAREDAIRDERPLKGSDVKTACQEACITTAIHFGDMNDPSSEINKFRNHKLGYYVLEDLNTRPNVTYIAKLRNTDKEDA
ncbi:MAG: TAT-variant-translocated molybdopterin oxidoreductase [Ignavibacteriaceae bacterium]|nr:TAT-variant-translocated molybdopterin oxidoreductase [Ignavibacteriaceae bacterium]